MPSTADEQGKAPAEAGQQSIQNKSTAVQQAERRPADDRLTGRPHESKAAKARLHALLSQSSSWSAPCLSCTSCIAGEREFFRLSTYCLGSAEVLQQNIDWVVSIAAGCSTRLAENALVRLGILLSAWQWRVDCTWRVPNPFICSPVHKWTANSGASSADSATSARQDLCCQPLDKPPNDRSNLIQSVQLNELLSWLVK